MVVIGGSGLFGVDKDWWTQNNYAIGLPMAATDPFGWRLAAYRYAVSVAPDTEKLLKLYKNNSRWIERGY